MADPRTRPWGPARAPCAELLPGTSPCPRQTSGVEQGGVSSVEAGVGQARGGESSVEAGAGIQGRGADAGWSQGLRGCAERP